MPIGLFIGICLIISILFVKLYKNITLFSFKTLAFGVDFFIVFFIQYIFLARKLCVTWLQPTQLIFPFDSKRIVAISDQYIS